MGQADQPVREDQVVPVLLVRLAGLWGPQVPAFLLHLGLLANRLGPGVLEGQAPLLALRGPEAQQVLAVPDYLEARLVRVGLRGPQGREVLPLLADQESDHCILLWPGPGRSEERSTCAWDSHYSAAQLPRPENAGTAQRSPATGKV